MNSLLINSAHDHVLPQYPLLYDVRIPVYVQDNVYKNIYKTWLRNVRARSEPPPCEGFSECRDEGTTKNDDMARCNDDGYLSKKPAARGCVELLDNRAMVARLSLSAGARQKL